ncbi:MAG: hypothetical protein RIR17_944 [Planctomycetota bacterium]
MSGAWFGKSQFLLPGWFYFATLGILFLIFGEWNKAFAQLDGVSEVGHSYQSDARGGTETAIGDTGLAHVRQPASTVSQGLAKFDSKITSIFIDNRWQDINDVSSSAVYYTLAYNLGLVMPLSDRFGLGLAYETGGWRTRFVDRYNAPDFSNPMTNSYTYSTQSVVGNLGYRVTDSVFIGAGPKLQILDIGMNLPSGPGVLQVPTAQAVGAGYQAGVIYQATEVIRLGASYASPNYFGGMNFGQATYAVPGANPVVGELSMDAFTSPGRISFGISASPNEKLKMAIEAGYLDYGNTVLGSMNFQGLVNNNLSMGFQNFWVMNTGMDYEFNEWFSGSIGYVFNTMPVNPSNMVPISASIVQNQFTYGLRFKHGRFWTGFAHIIGVPATLTSNASNHPDLGPDYQNSTVRQVLQSFNCGAGFQF